MHTFQGRTHTWEIALSIADCTRIKAHLKLDLLKADQPDEQQDLPIVQLYSDPELLIKTAALLGHKQLKENFAAQLAAGARDEITNEPLTLLDLFALELNDGAYEALRDAFLEELRDFFRRLGLAPRAAILSRQIEALQKSYAATADQIMGLSLTKALGRTNQQDLQALLDQSLESHPIPGDTSSSSPRSPASPTPAF